MIIRTSWLGSDGLGGGFGADSVRPAGRTAAAFRNGRRRPVLTEPAFSAPNWAGRGGWSKNAPFSADMVTETAQTLADGNHIKQTSTAHFSRDSEGRTRREQSLNAFGAFGRQCHVCREPWSSSTIP